MITINTNTSKPILDSSWKVIGNSPIYLTIEKLEFNINNVLATGYYYWKKQEEIITYDEENNPIINNIETIVKLRDIRTLLNWEVVGNIETILQPIDTLSLREAVLQRVMEFTMIQLTQESGDNFGTTIEDWE